MSYVTLSGTASYVKGGQESTKFRVGHQPVWIRATPHLEDGDLVSVVGHETNGTVRALAMRNDTTSVVSHRQMPAGYMDGAYPMLIFGALALCALVLFGRLVSILLPFVFLAAGFLLFLRYKRGEVDRAKEVLRQIPVARISP